MSQESSYELKCPSCKNPQGVTVWHSINVTIDPTLRARLFNGEINKLKCSKCGLEIRLAAPLLYHDMKRKFCVQYYPPGELEEAAFFRIFTPDGKPIVPGLDKLPAALATRGNYLSEPHIVFDLDEMCRYIVFRERLAETSAPGQVAVHLKGRAHPSR